MSGVARNLALLGLLVASASCSRAEPSNAPASATAAASASTPEATCKAAAETYAKSLAEMLLGKNATPEVLETTRKGIEPAIARVCETDKWDPKTIACLAVAKSAVDSEGCLDKLSKPIQLHLDEAVARALADVTKDKSLSPETSAVASAAAPPPSAAASASRPAPPSIKGAAAKPTMERPTSYE